MKKTNATKFDFSKFDKYRKCPLAYKWKYIDNKIPQKPPNMYYAFPGIIIQKIFEHFYNDNWFLKRKACREFMYNKAPDIFENTLKWCRVDWEAEISKKSRHDVYDEFLDMIGRNLDVIKEYELLGKLAKSEHKIIVASDRNHYVHFISKIDFLIQNKDGLQILDGKATSNKKSYLDDPSQLYFYAMMCKLKYGKYPDKLGYWFWRDGTITYVDFDEEKIEKLKDDIEDVLYKIHKKKFDANPEYKSCLFCDYKEECLDRKRVTAERRAEKVEEVTLDDLKMFE